MVLRRIKRRVRMSGEHYVEMLCGHIVAGSPESRFSRFYPCPPCDVYVQALRSAGAEQNPAMVLVPPADEARKSTKPRRSPAKSRSKAVARDSARR